MHRRFLQRFQAWCSFSDLWQVLRLFLSREYWNRVWILQEVLSATSLILLCGTRSLSAISLANALEAITCLIEDPRYTTEPGYLIVKKYHQYQRGNRDTTLAGLLDLCSMCKSQCQDPRDRIYGILSLTQNRYSLSPDYEECFRFVRGTCRLGVHGHYKNDDASAS